jgi:ketosteroid isomerase-like protein
MAEGIAARTIRTSEDVLTAQERAIADEIRDLQDRRARALENGDAAFHEDLLADDCTIVHGAGFAESKQDYIPSFIRRLEIRDAGYRDVTYRFFGETVIENGIFDMTVRQKLEPDGKFYLAVALYTIVWRKLEGMWKIVLIHQTRVPQ